ncbi:MAG: Wzz/FepE/Etk N-terminal domain-containing protein, partial [Pseudomonadota bacterium]
MEESLHRIRRALEPTGRAVPQAIAPTPSDDFDISHVVTGLWRNAWLIALCTVVAAALGYIYAFHVADVTYRSTASLVLRQDSREPLDGGGVASRIPLSAEEISTERAVVVSTTNLGEVATALGLIDDPEFNPYLTSNDEPPIAELRDEFYLTATVDELRQAIRAENLSGTTVIRVVVESLSPVKSRDIANAVIDQYQANEVALEEAARQEEIERLSARLQELQGQLVTVEAKIEDFQFSSSDPDERLRDTVELEKLGAEANAIRSLYQAMLERFSMVSVEEAPQRTESAVLDRAVLPIDNYSPREALILGASLLIGAFLGVALALARDAISDRIRGPRELGEMARRPVIAIAPKFERGKRFGTISRQFGLNQPVSIAAMESIRTSITLISDAKTRSPQVISVISGTPEEGKSPLALSLAASYAEAGTQVLLIDTDLRRRTLSKWLAPARNTGLISVLSGFIGLKDAVER